MCGIVGIVSTSPVNQALYDGLTVLQHRGQDAAGIATYESGRMYLRKQSGLVRDAFETRHMLNLRGNMGIGHVRYPTAGSAAPVEAQPFYVNSPYGITLAHNGNLINGATLRDDLFREDLRHINTDSDSELLLNVLAHELHGIGKLRIDAEDIFDAVAGLHKRCRGAYAAVAMITGVGIVAFRDPFGIRPLCFGRRETEAGEEYAVASESVALDALGYDFVRDVEPGEAVFLGVDGSMLSRQCAEGAIHSPCIFEYVYLARPDSIIDDISVYKARMRMGTNLAQKLKREWADIDIDVVIPIPDTSRTAALEMANELGIKYREGFIKNRYIPRTFIMPGQAMRRKSVRQKLNAIELEFKGKNVLLVDDSIVRGTTSGQIAQMAREAGANKVYFASAAPPVAYPNVYGIDMPAREELIAYGRSLDEICELVGCDGLLYQDIDDLIDAARRGNPRVERFDTSCFTGEYVTGDVTAEYLAELGLFRSDDAKSARSSENGLADLFASNG